LTCRQGGAQRRGLPTPAMPEDAEGATPPPPTEKRGLPFLPTPIGT
jgi:hypothetical protein